MVKLIFKETGFEIDLSELEKLAAFKGKLFIPYENLIRIDDFVGDIHLQARLGGTSLGQDEYDYGRFQTTEGYGFYVMKHKENAFVIYLRDNTYNFLVLEVDDKEEVIRELRSCIKSWK